mgnify:CR=1 FL=1
MGLAPRLLQGAGGVCTPPQRANGALRGPRARAVWRQPGGVCARECCLSDQPCRDQPAQGIAHVNGLRVFQIPQAKNCFIAFPPLQQHLPQDPRQ